MTNNYNAQLPFNHDNQSQEFNQDSGFQTGPPKSPMAHQQNAMGQQQAPVAMELAKSITQEDLLFMRRWQQDSMLYRVFPLTVVTGIGLHQYNKMKQLPNKLSRYILLSTGCFFIGKASYFGELKKRLAESPSDTVYMQAMRKALNVPYNGTAFDTFNPSPSPQGGYGFDSNYSDNISGRGSEFVTGEFDTTTTTTTSNQFGNFGTPFNQDNQVFTDYNTPNDDTNDPQTKPKVTSYEELRARNRYNSR